MPNARFRAHYRVFIRISAFSCKIHAVSAGWVSDRAFQADFIRFRAFGDKNEKNKTGSGCTLGQNLKIRPDNGQNDYPATTQRLLSDYSATPRRLPGDYPATTRRLPLGPSGNNFARSPRFSSFRACSSVFGRFRALSSIFVQFRVFSSVFERVRAFSGVFERFRAFSSVFEGYRAVSSMSWCISQ